MKLLIVQGVIILASNVVHVLTIGITSHSQIKNKLKVPCILLSVKKTLKGDRDESGFACELQGADAILAGPKILDINNDAIINWLESADVVSGISTLFSPDLYIAYDYLMLSGGVFAVNKVTVGNLVGPKAGSVGVEGTRSILIVRVQAFDKATSVNEIDLADSVFGNDRDHVTITSQYSACSYDKLNFVRANPRLGSNIAIEKGVTTVNVTTSTLEGSIEMRNTISTELISQFNVSSPLDLADHIMYCLPSGTMEFVAYAYMNHWNSLYSDVACTYYSIQMHEIGHNIGLYHSNEDALEYGDNSGFMGFSSMSDDYPLTCFNGAKSWQLGWYNDKQESINLSIARKKKYKKFTLAGVADYASTQEANRVVVRVIGGHKYYYVAFNRKIGMNRQTPTGSDQVLVTYTGTEENSSPSNLVASLSKGRRYIIADYGSRGNNVTIAVTDINLSSTPAWAKIIITNTDKKIPTSSPTLSPRPTTLPNPSVFPSPSVFPNPSVSPSLSVYLNPTNCPTIDPMVCPCGKLPLKIIVNTDNRGYEQRYFIQRMSLSGNWMGKKLLYERNLPSNTRLVHDICIRTDRCWVFKIIDNAGDGMSRGKGSYKLVLNGEVEKQSKFRKKSFEITKIGNCYTQRPTPEPAISPTKSPSKAPVTCPSGFVPLKITIKTDKFGNEVRYFLQRTSLDGNWIGEKIMDERNLDSNARLVRKKCIRSSWCYRFRIIDKSGDGLCCSNGRGSYNLVVAGEIRRRSDFSNKRMESTKLGRCEATPTISPVPTEMAYLSTSPSGICGSGMMHFKVVINTDNRGDQLRYFLKKKDSNGNWDKNNILFGEQLPSNVNVEDEACISTEDCCMFKITDSAGDGLCCSDETGSGSYQLTLDGVILRTSMFYQKDMEKTLTSNCWTISPAKSPSLIQS